MGMRKVLDKIEEVWKKDGLQGLLEKLKVEGIEPANINELLLNTFTAVESGLADGFQLMDAAPILSAALSDFMEIAESMRGATSREKLEFVTAMFIALYKIVDKGPDGDKNRVNIPWVPDAVEDFIEMTILPFAIRFAVEAVVAAWNKSPQ